MLLSCCLLRITARRYNLVGVTRRRTGQGLGTPRQRGRKTVTVQGGYGAHFAVQVQSFVSITRVAVQVLSKPRIYPRLKSWWWALAQCRVTIYLEARNLSRCRN